MRLGNVEGTGVQHNTLRFLAVLLHQLYTNHGTYINMAETADGNLFKQDLILSLCSPLNAAFSSSDFMQLYCMYTVMMNLIL